MTVDKIAQGIQNDISDTGLRALCGQLVTWRNIQLLFETNGDVEDIA